MTAGSYRYERAGFSIESQWPLPGQMPARSDTAPFGQLSIRRGPVPDALPGGVQVDPITQAAPGVLLLKHPSAGGFIARDGREILVQPAGADLGDLCPYVLSSGFAAICIQRGLLLLHASAVAIGDGAVAFAGPKGAGKSTLLGAFVGAGHAALADDMSLIETRSDQTAHLWAVPGYLRLWPDSVQALGLEDRPASSGTFRLGQAAAVARHHRSRWRQAAFRNFHADSRRIGRCPDRADRNRRRHRRAGRPVVSPALHSSARPDRYSNSANWQNRCRHGDIPDQSPRALRSPADHDRRGSTDG